MSVYTSSGCNWTATSNNTSWITITSGSSGSGNGTVSYSVSTNTSSSSRTGTMSIAGQTFTVTQEGVISCTDNYEPNDKSSTAYGPLSSGSSYSGKICSGSDVDWFKVNITTKGTISVNLTVPSSKDYYVELYGPSYTWVAGNHDVSISYNATTTGTYYIRVLGYNGSYNTTSSYTLTYKFTPISSPKSDLVVENLSVSPSRGKPGTSATVSFAIRNQGSGSSTSCTTNIRFNTSSSSVTTSDKLLKSVSTPSISPGSTYSVSESVTIPSGSSSGTYYIWVIADISSTANQSDVTNDKAKTSFYVETTTIPTPSPTPTPFTCSDSYEPNDNSSKAYGPLTSSSSYSGKICSGSDVDWFKVNITTKGTISLNLTVPSSKDYDLELYDPSYAWTAGSYSSNTSESISKNITTAGIYYIRISGSNGSYSTTSSYTLTYTFTSTTSATPTPTVTPVGKSKVEHVVIIDIDGLRPDVLQDCLQKGTVPNLEKLFGGNNLETATKAIWARNCRTNLPSVTLSGQATIFTGCYINKHGIFGNTWFDRQDGDGNVKNYMDKWQLMFQQCGNEQNRDLKGKTVYEEAAEKGLKSMVMWNQIVGHDFNCDNSSECIQSLCYRNSNFKYTDYITWNLPSETELPYYLVSSKKYDGKMVDDAIKALEKEEVPSIITLYFASVDHNAHCEDINTQADTLHYVDGKLKEFIDELSKLNDTGLEDVVFVLVSDHGHTKVKSDSKHQVKTKEIKKALEKLDKSFKVYIPAGEGEHRSFVEEQKSKEESNLVICANDGMAHFYVKNSNKNEWSETPYFSNDIIPLAHNLRKTQNTIKGKPDYIMKINGDEMILVKKRDEGKYKVYTGKGQNPNPYAVEDLDKYFKSLKEDIDVAEDAEDTIKNLYAEGSGDVLILTNFKKGYDVYDANLAYCAFDVARYLSGDHGSILDSDRKITFVICGEVVEGRVISENTNQVDVAPTISKVLGFEMPDADGNSIVQVDEITGRIKIKKK